jgi:hypothetical protein
LLLFSLDGDETGIRSDFSFGQPLGISANNDEDDDDDDGEGDNDDEVATVDTAASEFGAIVVSDDGTTIIGESRNGGAIAGEDIEGLLLDVGIDGTCWIGTGVGIPTAANGTFVGGGDIGTTGAIAGAIVGAAVVIIVVVGIISFTGDDGDGGDVGLIVLLVLLLEGMVVL